MSCRSRVKLAVNTRNDFLLVPAQTSVWNEAQAYRLPGGTTKEASTLSRVCVECGWNKCIERASARWGCR
eukprot:39979-Eustigmatos_ZCMA.PRE.1